MIQFVGLWSTCFSFPFNTPDRIMNRSVSRQEKL